jgi:hypothetical protein
VGKAGGRGRGAGVGGQGSGGRGRESLTASGFGFDCEAALRSDGRGARPHTGSPPHRLVPTRARPYTGPSPYRLWRVYTLGVGIAVVDLVNSWPALMGRDGALVHSFIHARPACEMLVSGWGFGSTARTDLVQLWSWAGLRPGRFLCSWF